MTRLMRFSTAAKREPAIEIWLDGQPDELGAIARRWFQFARGCGDDVREVLHDGHPTACVDDAAFLYVDRFTAHVNVGFYQGVSLPDPERLLLGDGKYMRHVKLRVGSDVSPRALEALIRAAHTDLRRQLDATRTADPRAT